MLPLLLILSAYGFLLSGNTLVVFHSVNGTYLMTTYYPFSYDGYLSYVSGVATVYYSNYTLTVTSTVPQLFAVGVSSGSFSGIVWSGISLLPVTIKVPAYVNGSGVVTLYYLNGTSYFVLRVPVVEGTNSSATFSGYVYRVYSVGPIEDKGMKPLIVPEPPMAGNYSFVKVGNALVPALVGQGYAYLFGLNGTVAGLIVENQSTPYSVVYVKAPSFPPSVSSSRFGSVEFTVLSNGSILSNVPYKTVTKLPYGAIIEANGSEYLVFSGKVFKPPKLIPQVTSSAIPTPSGDYIVLYVNVTSQGPVILDVPTLGRFVNVTSQPQGSVLYYSQTDGRLTIIAYGPAELTIYTYQPPAMGGSSAFTILSILALFLSIVLVILTVKTLRK
ncbi:MAG: hypothetical protein ACP5HQ_07315 [Thermoprotei archaeon]